MGECTLGTSTPLWVSCMQANVATSESSSRPRRSVCICSQPYHPVWCQIIQQSEMERASRPEPSANVLYYSQCRVEGCQFAAGPRLHTKSKGPKDAGPSCSEMRKAFIGTDVSIEDVDADVSAECKVWRTSGLRHTASPSLLGNCREQPLSVWLRM